MGHAFMVEHKLQKQQKLTWVMPLCGAQAPEAAEVNMGHAFMVEHKLLQKQQRLTFQHPVKNIHIYMGHFTTKWTQTQTLNLNYFIKYIYFVIANMLKFMDQKTKQRLKLLQRDIAFRVDTYYFVK